MNPLNHIENRLARIENSIHRLGVLVDCIHSQVHMIGSTPFHIGSDGSSVDEPEDTEPPYLSQVAPAG
jgi:hypothetical protein